MSSVASIAVALLFFNVTRLRLSSVAWKPRPESILTRSSLKLPVAMLLSPAKSSSSPPTPTKTSTEVAPLKAPVPSVTATAWYSVSSPPPSIVSVPSSVTMPSCTLKLPLATSTPNASSATEPWASMSTLASTPGMLAGTRPVVLSKKVVQSNFVGIVAASLSVSLAWFTFTDAL